MAGAKTPIRGGNKKGARRLFGRKGYEPVRTGRRPGVAIDTKAFPPAPPDWVGSLPEWAIMWAHSVLGLVEHQDFIYQRSQYGAGGLPFARLDFYEFDVQVGINVQGMYYHYGLGAEKIQSDLLQKVQIEARGFELVFIDEDDALHDPVYYLREARNFVDHSLVGRGVV